MNSIKRFRISPETSRTWQKDSINKSSRNQVWLPRCRRLERTADEQLSSLQQFIAQNCRYSSQNGRTDQKSGGRSLLNVHWELSRDKQGTDWSYLRVLPKRPIVSLENLISRGKSCRRVSKTTIKVGSKLKKVSRTSKKQYKRFRKVERTTIYWKQIKFP